MPINYAKAASAAVSPLPVRRGRRPLGRAFHVSRTCGPYRIPHEAIEFIAPLLEKRGNRAEAAALLRFLARYWSSPKKLGEPFPIVRRTQDRKGLGSLGGLKDCAELGQTEAQIRGAIKTLVEAGIIVRLNPDSGHVRGEDGIRRRVAWYRFAPELEAIFSAANTRPCKRRDSAVRKSPISNRGFSSKGLLETVPETIVVTLPSMEKPTRKPLVAYGRFEPKPAADPPMPVIAVAPVKPLSAEALRAGRFARFYTPVRRP
ncbi:hypothetical protein [Microvirga massiliensis]|uniref:hypothetical protein n=1 Tax=Microvirga massiliensis TaxID=1033741 RepID=UPI00065FB81E|nr:hypothetical protein [Microvirga massiliensis]